MRHRSSAAWLRNRLRNQPTRGQQTRPSGERHTPHLPSNFVRDAREVPPGSAAGSSLSPTASVQTSTPETLDRRYCTVHRLQHWNVCRQPGPWHSSFANVLHRCKPTSESLAQPSLSSEPAVCFAHQQSLKPHVRHNHSTYVAPFRPIDLLRSCNHSRGKLKCSLQPLLVPRAQSKYAYRSSSRTRQNAADRVSLQPFHTAAP